MTTGKDVLAVAVREVGYHENVGKRNKYGEWYGLNGQPWCMEFVQWVYHEAGADLPFKTASCGALLRWYREHQPECVTENPVPGCIVIFDFPGGADTDHTGLLVSQTADAVTTIDGNTSGASQSNGGWVQQKTRHLSYARPIYIVPRGLREGKGESDMAEKRYNTLDEIRGFAPWAAPTVQRLLNKGLLRGDENGLDLSADMLRMLVINDRAGVYQ